MSVYVVSDGKNYKIGYTEEAVKKRIESLQTGNANKLTLIHHMEGGRSLEKLFHKAFESKRLNGEWFDLSDEDIQIIKEWICPHCGAQMNAVENASIAARSASANPVEIFFEDKLTGHDRAEAMIDSELISAGFYLRVAEPYDMYATWIEDRGGNERDVIPLAKFNAILESKGYRRIKARLQRGGPQERYWVGLRRKISQKIDDIDPWDGVIANWIAQTRGGESVVRDGTNCVIKLPLTPETLLNEAIRMPKDRQNRQSLLRCGKSLRRLGWRRSDKTARVAGIVCCPYIPDLDEVGVQALYELRELMKSLPDAQHERYLIVLFNAPITTANIAVVRAMVDAELSS